MTQTDNKIHHMALINESDTVSGHIDDYIVKTRTTQLQLSTDQGLEVYDFVNNTTTEQKHQYNLVKNNKRITQISSSCLRSARINHSTLVLKTGNVKCLYVYIDGCQAVLPITNQTRDFVNFLGLNSKAYLISTGVFNIRSSLNYKFLCVRHTHIGIKEAFAVTISPTNPEIQYCCYPAEELGYLGVMHIGPCCIKNEQQTRTISCSIPVFPGEKISRIAVHGKYAAVTPESGKTIRIVNIEKLLCLDHVESLTDDQDGTSSNSSNETKQQPPLATTSTTLATDDKNQTKKFMVKYYAETLTVVEEKVVNITAGANDKAAVSSSTTLAIAKKPKLFVSEKKQWSCQVDDLTAATATVAATSALSSVSPFIVDEFRRGSEPAEICALEFNKQGNVIMCGSNRGTIHLFSLDKSINNRMSTMSFLSGVFSNSNYFDSKWSFINTRIDNNGQSFLAFFGDAPNIIHAITKGRLFYTFEYTPSTIKQLSCTRF